MGRALQGASQSRCPPRTPHSHHYLPPRREPTLVTLIRPLWMRCALPPDSYATDCVPSVELRHRLCLTSIPALLVQRRLRWFGRSEGELIKDLLHPTPPRTSRRAGGQLKTWATTIKADLEPISESRVFGHARGRKNWVKVSSELAQDRRPWSASV